MHVIVINMDYEFNPEEVCSHLWRKINDALIEAGFHPQGRSFFINLPEEEANTLARKVMDEVSHAEVDQNPEFEKPDIYAYLKCFYSFRMEHITNLMLPDADQIQVTSGFSFHDLS